MIIYGTGEKKLTISRAYVKSACPQCGEFAINYHFFKKYFHLFWIPVFPYGNRSVAHCEKCNATYQDIIPQSLKREMENAKGVTGTPIYLFSGLALIVIAVSSIIYFNDGTETYYYPSKKKQAVGKYVNEKQEGKWTYWYENGKLQSEQYYKNGAEDSVWTWYGENGFKTKVGAYRNGVSHGKWLFYYPSGKLQEEETFVDNRKQGVSTFYYENGKIGSKGNFDRDREQGLWTYWYEDGNKMQEGAFDNGAKSGNWKHYYSNGKQSEEILYKDSLSYIIYFWNEASEQLVKEGSGKLITYYDNKEKSAEGEIRDGLYNGDWTTWYEDGKLKNQGIYNKGSYTLKDSWDSQGKLMVKNGNGYHKDLYENDVVATECLYRDGKLHGLLTTRSMENTLTSEINYANGKCNGKYKIYNEEGKVSIEGDFKNNLQEGMWTWYHLNGEKEASVNFSHGEKEGEEIFWSESGKIVKREFYNLDKLIKEELY